MGRPSTAILVALLVVAVVGGASNDARGAGQSANAAAASATPSAPLPHRQRARLKDAVLRGLREAATPGVVVGVQTPEGRWVKPLGIANERLMRPMRATVHHRIGSVTKTFIGTLLMQLVGDHELSLADTIDQYVEGCRTAPR
jgi:D-alanyl-D-alanine carboxypeptidase